MPGGLGQLQSWHRLNNFLKGQPSHPFAAAGSLSLRAGRLLQENGTEACKPHPTHPPLTPHFIEPALILVLRRHDGFKETTGSSVLPAGPLQNCVGIDGAVMGGVVNGGQARVWPAVIVGRSVRGLGLTLQVDTEECLRRSAPALRGVVAVSPAQLRIPPFDRFITHHAQRVPLVSPGSLSTVQRCFL
ncbi:hypothetical protein AAFF_G00109930 [Aldrovandia affinis]|uniref:Uncharacterized protein n=1 Tax=Aldrovandia affinis TaxID=143900 RepID=A0AAD7R165_9TELE|nr:hypothetical protein AAFF_G00109930 [Aldrovandia affinis]